MYQTTLIQEILSSGHFGCNYTIVAEMELCGAWADIEYCKKLKEKYEAKLVEIDAQLNDEILKIKPIIEKWKTSASGLERDRVFPPESRAKVMTEEQLEQKYPLYDPISNLRYRHSRTFASQLKDPINLSSPKQLGILLYMVLQAPVVNRRKPNGTGKNEIAAIEAKVEVKLKEHYDLVTSGEYDANGFEDDEEEVE